MSEAATPLLAGKDVSVPHVGAQAFCRGKVHPNNVAVQSIGFNKIESCQIFCMWQFPLGILVVKVGIWVLASGFHFPWKCWCGVGQWTQPVQIKTTVAFEFARRLTGDGVCWIGQHQRSMQREAQWKL